MKSLLVILRQGPLAGQQILESLSAIMVLATYGLQVQVVFSDDALGLIPPTTDHVAPMPPMAGDQRSFKSAQALIESFEFYDLLPIWIDRQALAQQPALANHIASQPDQYQAVDLSAVCLNDFDGILQW